MSDHEQQMEAAYHRMMDDAESGARCLANLEEILSWASGCDRGVTGLYRSIYKYVACGPWLAVRLHDGTELTCSELRDVKNEDVRALEVGSIVEGIDACVEGEELDLLKFEDPAEARKAFWEIVDRVNREACDLWEEANGEGGGAEDDNDPDLDGEPSIGLGATRYGVYTASHHRAVDRLRKRRLPYEMRGMRVKMAIEVRILNFTHHKIRHDP
jgi:nitrogen regulatory protein PII-like uncharacterized protein